MKPSAISAEHPSKGRNDGPFDLVAFHQCIGANIPPPFVVVVQGQIDILERGDDDEVQNTQLMPPSRCLW